MINYNLSQKALFDVQLTLAFSSISGTYAKVGTPTEHPGAMVYVYNLTNEPVQFSFDGVNDTFVLDLAQYVLFDFRANRSNESGGFYLPVGTQFWVKQIGATAPTENGIYISIIYGG